MRTKSFLIAAISVISLLLATSALVVAKKPQRRPLLIATFDDGPQYALTSDGDGTYANDGTFMFGVHTAVVNTGDRFVHLDLTRCASASGTCIGPFDLETEAGYYYVLVLQTSWLFDMEPGTTTDVYAAISKKLNRHEWLHLENQHDTPPYEGDTQVEAFNTDGDLTTAERWVFTCPEDAVWTAKIHGKGNKVTETDSEFYIPFKVTIEFR